MQVVWALKTIFFFFFVIFKLNLIFLDIWPAFIFYQLFFHSSLITRNKVLTIFKFKIMKNLHSVFKIILRSTPPHYDSSTPSGWFTCCHLPSYLYSCCSAHLKCFIFTHHPPILQTIPHPSQLRSCGSLSYNPSLAIHSLHSLFFLLNATGGHAKERQAQKNQNCRDSI